MGSFDLLDVSATCDTSGRNLTLVVVNRDPDREVETTLQLADSAFEGDVVAYEITGGDPASINDFDHQTVGVSERSVSAEGDSFEHGFPTCSVTVLPTRLAR
jgi:alpha-L-arabinofuranosidase